MDETIIYFTSSVIFPPEILTKNSDVVTIGTKSTTLAGLIYTYSPGPYTGPASPKTTPDPPPGLPPPGQIGSVRVTKISCDGICGCIGFGCPAGGFCLGPGCGAEGDGDDDQNHSCSPTYTVTDCQVACSITDFGTSVTATCYSTICTTALASAILTPEDPDALPPVLGGGGDFGYTYITRSNIPTHSPSSPAFIDCNFHGQDPDQGIIAQYCVCSSSTFPASTNTAYLGESCAYTTLPTKTTSISTLQEVVTSNYQVCTYAGLNAQYSTIEGCTLTSTIPSMTTTTVTVTLTADCAFWQDLYYIFEIYNIAYWATDGGQKLHSEKDKCGAITGWDWYPATASLWPRVYFNIDYFIKAGCIERAIASAGGPKLSCVDRPVDRRKRELGGRVENRERGSHGKRGRRTATTVAASYKPPSLTLNYKYPASFTSRPVYVPMVSSDGDRDPVVVTSTLMSERATLVPTTPT
ncbi:hypothetical protein F4804DRAFT_336110 [Jackrogersella minutella]|nr:hypothetical protein F4804DRAFT_336110 [Jackrogersella minutella]